MCYNPFTIVLQEEYKICIAVGEWQKPRIASLKGNQAFLIFPFCVACKGKKQPQLILTAVVFLCFSVYKRK